jgi:hypothetical protein
VDDGGLWQLAPRTREVRRAVPLEPPVARAVAWAGAASGFEVRVGLAGGGGLRFEAASAACEPGSTSVPGGACTLPCARGLNYVDPAGGACVPCGAPACAVGELAVACGASAPARCEPCPPAPAGSVYTVPGECGPGTLRPAPPCAPGWYGVGGAYCELCPPFSATLLAGAVRAEQCKCWPGFRRGPGRAGRGRSTRSRSRPGARRRPARCRRGRR